MTPQLVVFDCDGVLVDTEAATAAIIAENLTQHGLPVTPRDVAALFTGGTMESVGQEATRRGARLPDNWLDDIYTTIYARMAAGVEVFDGVLDLLDALEDMSVPCYVASNGTMEKMHHSLGPSGLWDRFGGHFGGRILSREDHAPKPDPAMIRHAIAQTGAAAQRTVMIDDSSTGCRAGINAGVRTIGFATEGQDTALAAIGAEVVNTMADIRRLLLG